MVLAAAIVPLKKDIHEITINIGSIILHFDQVLHSVVYLLICLYYPTGQYLGIALFKDNSFKKFFLLILILAIVTEVIQLIIPSRAFNFFDLIANAIGIGIGFLIASLLHLKCGRKVRSE